MGKGIDAFIKAWNNANPLAQEEAVQLQDNLKKYEGIRKAATAELCGALKEIEKVTYDQMVNMIGGKITLLVSKWKKKDEAEAMLNLMNEFVKKAQY